MKKLLLALLFALIAYPVSAQTWLMVPKSVTVDKGGVTHIRPDVSALPLPVARVQGKPVVSNSDCPKNLVANGCYLVQVHEDFSKVGPTALSNWSKPTPTAITNELKAQGIDPNAVKPVPPLSSISTDIKSAFWKAWEYTQPDLAWALVCPGGSACDDFNRGTDSFPLNGSWTNYRFPASGSSDLLGEGDSVVYAPTTTGIYLYSATTAVTFGADQEAQVAYYLGTPCAATGAPTAPNCAFGPIVRSSATAFYVLFVNADDHYSEVDIFDITGAICGTAYCTQTIAQDYVTTYANADILKLRIVGSSLTASKNATPTMTPTDSGIASGQPGMFGYDTFGCYCQGMDDFIASNIASGTVVRHHPVMQ